MTLDEALTAIRTATRWTVAANIRNAIAFEARDHLRPWEDVTACEAAVRERWGDEMRRATVGIDTPRAGGNWVGG